MKKHYYMSMVVVVLCMLMSVIVVVNMHSGMVKEEGLYNFTLDEENPEYDADAVIPDKETLVNNLLEAGYEIEEYTTALNSEIAANRVVATKGKEFMDICYGLTEEEAEQVFAVYEAEYLEKDFRVLARNEQYVYCAGSEETLQQSGFESFSNNGVVYINN